MRILELLEIVSDAIFPPRTEERTVRALTEADVRSCYAEVTIDGVTSLSLFSDARLRALIHEAKYERSERAQKLLSVLFRTYRERHPEAEQATVIPIPLSRERMRARGYNQVAEVLKNAGIEPNIEALARVRNTRPQIELDRNERRENMHDAFVCTIPSHVYGKDILLIDDVVTTGATLRAAKIAILQHEPRSLTCIALAH